MIFSSAQKTTNSVLPQGPSKKNFFQFLAAINYPFTTWDHCKQTYGKNFSLKYSGQPDNITISDPHYLKQIFSSTAEQLNTGEINGTLLQPILGDYSLLTLDGKKHMQHRKLLLPPFHGQRMKEYGQLMCKISKEQIATWKINTSIKLIDGVRKITYHVILSTVFGIDESNTRYQVLSDALENFLSVASKPFAVMTLLLPFMRRRLGRLTPYSRMMDLRKTIDDCLFEEIAARKSADLSDRTDILSLLLQARDEEGNQMTAQEIRDEMLTLLLAGHETSTTGIAWAFYGILSNPEVFSKLSSELQEFGTTDSELLQNLDKLTYLDAVVKESLRITPVLPNLVRVANEDYQLGEYRLPKGTIISPCIYLTHRDPDYWSDPDKFMPERFLNGAEKPFTYFPFGHGIRRCIGAAFAQYEMKIIITQIMLKLDLSLTDNYRAAFERRGPVFAPSRGLPVIVNKRHDEK